MKVEGELDEPGEFVVDTRNMRVFGPYDSGKGQQQADALNEYTNKNGFGKPFKMVRYS